MPTRPLWPARGAFRLARCATLWACVGNYSFFYSNGSCLKGCPDGFICLVDENNSFCQASVSILALHVKAVPTLVLLLLPTYLYLQGSLFVNASSCPNLTYANSTTSQCTPCLSHASPAPTNSTAAQAPTALTSTSQVAIPPVSGLRSTLQEITYINGLLCKADLQLVTRLGK